MKNISTGILASLATALFTITIIVPPPLPTDASPCKRDGWAQHGFFKNQGDRASSRATDDHNRPSFSL